MNSPTAERVHKINGIRNWSGHLSLMVRTVRAAWRGGSRDLLGRPRLRAFSAARPPARYRFIQPLTARRVTPKMRAASVCGMPPRTASTARIRMAS